MSRMKTDLRPAMSSNRRSSNKSLPPVRYPRSSQTPDLEWDSNIKHSLQVRAMSSKARSSLTSTKEASVVPKEQKNLASTPNNKIQQEENLKLKSEIEKLRAKIASLQKINGEQTIEISEKSALIAELKKQLQIQAEDYERKCKNLTDSVSECKKEINSLEKKYKESTDERNMLKEKFVKETEEIKKECAQKLADISAAHKKEMDERDEKLRMLKMKMADTLGDNSRERQQQLEALSRELKRMTEEYDIIKAQLMGTKSENKGKCQNCYVLEKQLQSKIVEMRNQEVSVINLQQLCSKMERQLVQQDELLRQWAKSQGKEIT